MSLDTAECLLTCLAEKRDWFPVKATPGSSKEKTMLLEDDWVAQCHKSNIYSLHGRCSFWRHGSFPQSAKDTWYAHIAESTRQAMSNIVKVILDCGILASWLYDGWLMMCTPGGCYATLFGGNPSPHDYYYWNINKDKETSNKNRGFFTTLTATLGIHPEFNGWSWSMGYIRDGIRMDDEEKEHHNEEQYWLPDFRGATRVCQ